MDPEKCMILIKPREVCRKKNVFLTSQKKNNIILKGESCIRTEDILKILEEQGSEISLILFSGVQYYTGQLFQIKEITEAAHKQVYLHI